MKTEVVNVDIRGGFGPDAAKLEGKRVLWHAAQKVRELETEANCRYGMVVEITRNSDEQFGEKTYQTKCDIISYVELISLMLSSQLPIMPPPKDDEIPMLRFDRVNDEHYCSYLNREYFFGLLDEPCP